MKKLISFASKMAHTRCLMVFLLIVAVFPVKSQCQHIITHSQYLDDVNKTIVKEYNFPATISYVETKGHHYFSYTDASMTITNCEIGPSLFICDFIVLDEIIYFCGYDTNTKTVGIWGYFNAYDLINKNLSYEIYDDFSCTLGYADTLNSLVFYDNKGVTTFVVVGTVNDGTSVPRGCTIEITPSTSGTFTWDYTMGVTPNDRMENIKHVCLTDNYVITSGLNDATASFEVYRRHLRSNIFAVGGPQNQYWVFPTSNNPKYVHRDYPYAITHIGGDTIVAVLSYENISVPPPQYGIIVKTYDMTNPVIGVTSSFFVFHQNTLANLISVQGLKYDKLNNSVVLLLYGIMPLGPNPVSIIAEIPITSTIPTPYQIHYWDKFKLTSIDLYNSGQSLVCQGYDIIDNSIVHYYTQPLATAALCIDNLPTSSYDEIYITKGDPAPYNKCIDSFNCKKCVQLNLFENPNEIICSE